MLIICIMLQFLSDSTLKSTSNVVLRRDTPPCVLDSPGKLDLLKGSLRFAQNVEILTPKIEKATEFKEALISPNELLLHEVNMRDLIIYRERVKKAKSDKEVMLLKLEAEKKVFQNALEMARIEGKETEEGNLEVKMEKVQRMIQELEVER